MNFQENSPFAQPIYTIPQQLKSPLSVSTGKEHYGSGPSPQQFEHWYRALDDIYFQATNDPGVNQRLIDMVRELQDEIYSYLGG